jgi:hypothetical protein
VAALRRVILALLGVLFLLNNLLPFLDAVQWLEKAEARAVIPITILVFMCSLAHPHLGGRRHGLA